LAVIVPVGSSFLQSLQDARSIISRMTEAMQSLFPTLCAMLTAVGANASVGVLQPAIVFSVTGMATIISSFVMPVLTALCALTLLGCFVGAIQLEKLKGFLSTVVTWSLGTAFTVFFGVLTVSGVAGAAFDKVSLEAAKYAIDNFVPVVGGMFADAVDVLVGCSMLVKNAVGITGVVAIVAMIAQPAISILSQVLLYKLCAAAIEPIADGALTGALEGVGKMLTLLFITILTVAAMFFVIITAAMLAGGQTVAAMR
jgi:stage III sporulation protein AE